MRHHSFLSGVLALTHTRVLCEGLLRSSSSPSLETGASAGRVALRLRSSSSRRPITAPRLPTPASAPILGWHCSAGTSTSFSAASSPLWERTVRRTTRLTAFDDGVGGTRSVITATTTFAATGSEVRAAAGPSSSSLEGPSEEAAKKERVMQDVLYRVRDVNKMPDAIRSSLLDFTVDGQVLGKVLPVTAELLCSASSPSSEEGPPTFEMQAASGGLTLSDKIEPTYEARTAAVARVTQTLKERGIVKGWRDELYPVTTGFYNTPTFAMERAAIPLLGAIEYGVHINGLVASDNNNDASPNEPKMWMARRSRTKSKFPGMLDHLVAGGQPIGIGLLDNAVKECFEEAGIPEDLARRNLRPAGAISYQTYNGPTSNTVSRAVLFNFDLHLPAEFVPTPVDGEVEEFFVWTIDELFASMAPNYPDPIKPNCYSG